MKYLTVWLVPSIFVASLLLGERLPVKTYTTADGLARDHILCIVQDSHGFLWFCTAEGLSRFDGYQFTNYRTEQGLPANAVTGFLETRAGVYWVGTAGGLCRFDPGGAGASRFHCYPLSGDHGVPAPSLLYEDRAGVIWCGTFSGNPSLLRLDPKDASFRRVDLRLADPTVTALLLDRKGTLWAGSPEGLYRRDPDGSTKIYTTAGGLPNSFIMALLEDSEGRLWIGTRKGLARLDSQSTMHVYTEKNGLPSPRIESLLESADHKLWVGTTEGLAEWMPAASDQHEFQSYTLAQGLSARSVGALAEDRDGNLWIGTFGSGAMKIARSGFITYTATDGVPYAASLMESRQGEMCILSRSETSRQILRFDGRRFAAIRPAWPSRITYYGWGSGQVAVQDRTGEWWIATGQGLCRFARVASVNQLAQARPKAVYTMRDGLPGDKIFRVFEDGRTNIWIGTENGLALWDRTTGRVHAFSAADGLPAPPVPTAFTEDRSGSVWVSFFHQALARYRNGKFTVFTASDAVPGFLNALFLDSTGRLWIASSRGLVRIDDPTAERPRFATYSTAQGLSSDYIAAITEDRWGRIYAATGRGIDRIDPQPASPSRIKHYTTADGIVPGELDLAFRDRHGTLWFSTPLGVSEFNPGLERARAPPPVLVTGLSIGGVSQPISDLGQSAVSGLRLPQKPLRIDFVGLGFSAGETLRYQYILEGADRDWSALTDQRSVLYASLSPGSYRFLVRAITSDREISPQPASVMFTILPPLWRSWWFMAACGIVAALIVYALHRYRLAQLLAVANVRTRIATDLHDDIGASLSQIAVLSEVARTGAAGPAPLSDIAGISRELVDSMSDIVWAINPEHDRLSNLVYRMRRFANDLLGSQHIGLHFRSAVADLDLKVGADMRRQIYLIFKEAIHNIARHSGATRVDVEFDRIGDNLVLHLTDNGKGFDPAAENGGQGLASMRKRAASLGAKIDFESSPGQGATLRMTVSVEGALSIRFR